MDPNLSKRPVGAERPFPWRCRHCGQDQVFMTTTSYDAEVRRDGRLLTLKIPNLEIPVCRACGEKVFTEAVDEQIAEVIRSQPAMMIPTSPALSPGPA